MRIAKNLILNITRVVLNEWLHFYQVQHADLKSLTEAFYAVNLVIAQQKSRQSVKKLSNSLKKCLAGFSARVIKSWQNILNAFQPSAELRVGRSKCPRKNGDCRQQTAARCL